MTIGHEINHTQITLVHKIHLKCGKSTTVLALSGTGFTLANLSRQLNGLQIIIYKSSQASSLDKITQEDILYNNVQCKHNTSTTIQIG